MCVANKVIEGTQCNILWHTDDNKLSHKNPEVISDIINEVKKSFGELYGERGNKHTLLGMNIQKKDNTIQVNIVKQFEECIESFGEGVSTLVTYMATKKLFEVR